MIEYDRLSAFLSRCAEASRGSQRQAVSTLMADLDSLAYKLDRARRDKERIRIAGKRRQAGLECQMMALRDECDRVRRERDRANAMLSVAESERGKAWANGFAAGERHGYGER